MKSYYLQGFVFVILVVNAERFASINSKNTNLPSNEVTNGGWKDVFAPRFIFAA